MTDASHIGWGATLGSLEASGQWTARVSHQSSNMRELTAILMAVLSFRNNLRGRFVQILTDNITALAYVANQGGPCGHLTQVARAIWTLAIEEDITLQIRHISGVANTEADRLSRIVDRYNWMLHPRVFHAIDRAFGPHTVDRFASVTNTQLARFNSRFWEPRSEGVDALAQSNWGEENNYVNAPFRMLGRVLDVVSEQRASAMIIAPYWPSQPWFQRLLTMATSSPIQLPNSSRTFRCVGASPEPFHNRAWRIYAWHISGARGSSIRDGHPAPRRR